ncbi:MAG TPA: nuclear transport factor 2 family protein [Elusimicrobiota bacterium]|nr:nuclear transport factor 2 family protein [Elusimicrobiota bacterium]
MMRVILLLSSFAWARPPIPTPTQAVNMVVDTWHEAASKADEATYFKLFAPDAVFLGTDGTERWPVAEFRKYAHQRFATGKGWTITPKARRVSFSPDGKVAWFDEDVVNAKWGPSRGSGVLVQIDGLWKIAQYNYSVPIPNDLLPKVVDMIRAAK